MRVFVAGGTGVIGRQLVPRLVARGHQVTATTTSAAKLGVLEQLGADGVVMDGLDGFSVGAAVAAAGPDVIVHQMTGLSVTHAGRPNLRKPGRFFAATGYFSWVHLGDAASATVLAVEQQARGVFNIVDDEPAPVSQWLPYLAECAGAKPPRRLPRWLARLLAGEMVVGMMTEGRGFANAKAKAELGWQLRYPSWRQGFKEELA